ncbi:MAG: cytochrome c5 [bacterium]|nr:MAG: cytochrome c5 [bacterium]KAF0150192.1 MAG: cytochrome c5 [bacterium]KAF0169672.1 MAG: cytochrome c5 [bacterium]TXT22935.1 MAG: cytochrome c5 [bacterium]
MAEHVEMTKTTPKEFLYATLGGLFAPGLAIVLIVLLLLGIQGRMGQPDAAPLSDQAVRERIQPFGKSIAVDPNAPKVERTGEQVYNEVCAGCHASGALGSPKHKERADWGKRLAGGYDTLLTHAIKGFNKMPARGGDPDLSDLEVARGVVYMTNAVGASFEATLKKEPEPTAAELARGKAVYADNCASCHDTGVTGAQKLSDAKAWAALIKEGKEYLYAAAINGSFGGPAKGGNEKLSDADTRLAVDYMVAEAKLAIEAAAKQPAKQAAQAK